MSDTHTHRGACFCGAVHFTVTGEVDDALEMAEQTEV